MIQAHSYARNGSHLDISEQTVGVTRVKRTYTRVNGKRLFIIKTGILLFGYALVLVYLCIKSATLGYQIVDLQKQINNLDTHNKRIEYQIASHTSLQRIEELAVKNLDMYKPDASSMLQVAVQSKPAKTASLSQTMPSKQSSTGVNTLHKVYKNIAVMAR